MTLNGDIGYYELQRRVQEYNNGKSTHEQTPTTRQNHRGDLRRDGVQNHRLQVQYLLQAGE